MAASVKLKFDPNLDFQKEAIESVADMFDGFPLSTTDFEVSLGTVGRQETLHHTELGIGHGLFLDKDQMLQNLHAIQERNNIPKSRRFIEEGDTYAFPNFSVEMETGTGKTYVYLRTIFELSQKYGFRKFIIVVPSVAIREGVLSSIDLMKEHFRGLYNNAPFDHFVYNSKDLSKVRQFAVSNEIQIMIINIQAFQKDAGDVDDYSSLTDEQRKRLNVIHQEQDRMSGRRPIEFVRATNPVVIIDEPQSVDNTDKAKRALKTLNPLFCLRYSATHINPYNLLYQLGPIQAYDMKLVKQIEVASIQAENRFNQVFIRLESIGYAKDAKIPHAKAAVHVDTPQGPKEKKITLKQGTDLSAQTDRPGYDGYIVTNICAEDGLEHVEFANGKILTIGQEEGGMTEEVHKAQIKQTVEEHLKKEKKYQGKGIKVLSLFFIDKVANYRWYDESRNSQPGKLAQWFEEAFMEMTSKKLFKNLLPYTVSDVHNGYFSVDSKGIMKDTRGNTKADDDTYHLIMRDKERLLSPEEPLRFIFSHSALKEGWDNPNVFQICTLREMGTERERRQTLGRGLRLPVNRGGERIFDTNINKLTVIASESFEEYARGLQEDIERDCQFKFGRIEPIAFAQLGDSETGEPLGQEESREVWTALVKAGYLDQVGDMTDKFAPEREGFILDLPDPYNMMGSEILDVMKKYVFKGRVVNARERRTLKYNKRIELNEDFKILWDKIKYKTRYSVEFETKDLIERAAERIRKAPPIQQSKLVMNKMEVEISEAGVEGGRILDSRETQVGYKSALPDILAYLQKDTELTRNTLVEILKQSGRLGDFPKNPQSFMTESANLINRTLHSMVIDGIKYERINNQQYEMRLFESEEIETYMSQLYEVQSTDDRTPFDCVPFDSDIEEGIAEQLDSHERVKFFCKLPGWFKIPTPVGSYNPDWAIVTEDDGKLYLVRETKSTHDSEKRRGIENKKIECGRAHFRAIDINFEVAMDIYEVLQE